MSATARIAAGLFHLAQISRWPKDLSDPQFYHDRGEEGGEFWVLRYSDDGRDRFYLIVKGTSRQQQAMVEAMTEILGQPNSAATTPRHTFVPREENIWVTEWSTYALETYLRQAGLFASP